MFGDQGTEKKDEETSKYIPQGFRPGTIGKVVTIQTFHKDPEDSGRILPNTLAQIVGVLKFYTINKKDGILSFCVEDGSVIHTFYKMAHVEIYIHS